MNIQEVLIAYDEAWPEKHIHSLQTAYGKTAFAEEVLEGVAAILESRKERLWDLNLTILDYLVSLLKGQLKYSFTPRFEKSYPIEVFDFRSGIHAGITGISTKAIPEYLQVQRLQQSFQPNLTILDALCHLGGDTLDYLARYAAQLYPTS